MSNERTYHVDMLTRVEGEGRFTLRVNNGVVEKAELSIFEAPRFFEALLRGRSLFEVPDITARICGICPVAYQTSSANAMESALGLELDPEVQQLRRLLYCGEWIESHALHVFLLHAPDFLGYPSAIEMAAEHRDVVERGLRIKKYGNAILETLGARAVHPLCIRVGGMTHAPRRDVLKALTKDLEQGLYEAEETVRWASGLEMPHFEHDAVFVALGADRYPIEQGHGITLGEQASIPLEEFDTYFQEQHVPHSNALHCRLLDGRPYLCGPLARINLFAEYLHPRAQVALESLGLALPIRNPYRSIIARAVEIVHAFAEALDLINTYRVPAISFTQSNVQASTGYGASEAPRGLLWHRYVVDEEGLVTDARIVPPTSQNQARIEDDLARLGTQLSQMTHEDATLLCEQLIRAYDPCISCATHFLRLEREIS